MKQLKGGDRPTGRGRYVTVTFRDGRVKTVPAGLIDWRHDEKDSENDVVAWRFPE